MSRKVRIDRWDADLTEEQRWAAYDKAHGTPWYLWAQWVREQYGAEVSRAGYYRWMAAMREGASSRRLEQAAIAIAEAGKLADKAGNRDEILAGAYKALAADAAMSSGDSETAQRYVQMAMAISDRRIKTRELQIKAEMGERETAAEKRAAVAEAESRRLRDEIADLKARLADAGKVNAVDPAKVADEVDKLLGRK